MRSLRKKKKISLLKIKCLRTLRSMLNRLTLKKVRSRFTPKF